MVGAGLSLGVPSFRNGKQLTRTERGGDGVALPGVGTLIAGTRSRAISGRCFELGRLVDGENAAPAAQAGGEPGPVQRLPGGLFATAGESVKGGVVGVRPGLRSA